MRELSEDAKKVCKDNYHACYACPMNKECFRSFVLTRDRHDDWVNEVNEKAKVITSKQQEDQP